MAAEARSRKLAGVPVVRSVAVWGPGLLVMLAGTDAGNIVTAAQSGARWGYRLLPLVLLLIPMLYVVQELTTRLGIYTGRGHGELIREQFGLAWACLSSIGLAAATVGSLITEFTAVAGIGEVYSVSRSLTLPLAVLSLLLIVGTGSYRRVERAALVVGLFELAFFAVAWASHPSLKTLADEASNLPVGDAGFMFLVAAIIGATFNPWMIFYQQSATVDKKLQIRDLKLARLETGIGAALTQCLTGSVLIAAAATLRSDNAPASLHNVGEISNALTPLLGARVGRLVFGAGVLGASLVAAIVSSLALSWGVGEVSGYRRSLEYRPFEAKWFYALFAVCVGGAALLVWQVSDLVWLTIAAQVVNALLMPLVIGLVVALAVKALPAPVRLQGFRLRLIAGFSTIICGLGLYGAIAGLM